MCKSTRGTQTASQGRLRQIQPNAPGGSGGGTPVPPALQREHVPDIVFIATGSDGALQSAVDFHQFFGLRGSRLRRFSSIENLVSLLAADTSHLSRIRIVAHAEGEGILAPMVEGDARVNIEKTELRAFLRGDGDWLFTKIQRFHFLGSGATANQISEIILNHILSDTTTSAVLTPFNYTSSSHPNSELRDFVLCTLTPAIVNGNFLKRSGSNLSSAQKSAFITAYERILELSRRRVLESGDYAGVTITHLNALRDAIRNFTFAQYGVTPGATDIGPPTVTAIVQSVRALNANLRAHLEQVQQRFDATSWIDIRGCRAGTDSDYLVSISEFFGRSTNRPHVSGPRWFQKFPTIGFNTFANLTDFDDVFVNGISASDGTSTISGSAVRDALDRWFVAVRYDQNYFNAWHTALNGSAASFCLMTWRATIPSTFLLREGKQHNLAALNFVETITRIKSIFGVATGSQPTTATLTGLQNFVSNTLPGYMQKLTQSVTTATIATVFGELRDISQAESASIVPPTQPPGLTVDQVRTFQTQLIEFISTNRLQHINSLLVTARTFVNGGNGKYQLYLRFALPGLVIFDADFPNNRIFVLDSEKHNGLRIFLREMWEEPLPTPNNIAAAQLIASRPQDRPITALASDHQDTFVAVCPMPNYFANITTI